MAALKPAPSVGGLSNAFGQLSVSKPKAEEKKGGFSPERKEHKGAEEKAYGIAKASIGVAKAQVVKVSPNVGFTDGLGVGYLTEDAPMFQEGGIWHRCITQASFAPFLKDTEKFKSLAEQGLIAPIITKGGKKVSISVNSEQFERFKGLATKIGPDSYKVHVACKISENEFLIFKDLDFKLSKPADYERFISAFLKKHCS